MKKLIESIMDGNFPAMIFFKQFKTIYILPKSFLDRIESKQLWKTSELCLSITKKSYTDSYPLVNAKHFPYNVITGIFLFNSPVLDAITSKEEFFENHVDFEKEMEQTKRQILK